MYEDLIANLDSEIARLEKAKAAIVALENAKDAPLDTVMDKALDVTEAVVEAKVGKPSNGKGPSKADVIRQYMGTAWCRPGDIARATAIPVKQVCAYLSSWKAKHRAAKDSPGRREYHL